MRRFLIEYSVCDFESERVFRGATEAEAVNRFFTLVVELGGLEKGDVDYYTVKELETA
jgi:hypothetical protein